MCTFLPISSENLPIIYLALILLATNYLLPLLTPYVFSCSIDIKGKEHLFVLEEDFSFKGAMKSILLYDNRLSQNLPSSAMCILIALYRTGILVLSFLLLRAVFYKLDLFQVFYKGSPELNEPKINILITMITTFVIIFWNTRSRYFKKWEYLASLYNKHAELKTLLTHNQNEAKEKLDPEKDYLFDSLIHDIHALEFWGHTTYKDIFGEYIEKYIIEKNLENEKYHVIKHKDLEDFLGKTVNNSSNSQD